jgi:uncharacterized membrane protein (UPF0127 family)
MKNANPVSAAAGRWAVAVAAWALAGCGPDRPAGAAAAGTKSVYDHFTIAVGGVPARLQLAILPGEQQRGLMQRPDLGPDEGMLFVCGRPQPQAFWMHNTPEPLDLGYLTPDGTLAEIYPLLPLDERTVRSHSSELQFALEMPAGWFAAHGIHPGAKLDLPATLAAIRARGFDPVKMKLE